MRRLAWIVLLVGLSGCSLIPEVVHQPVVHNPFPQLSKVAVAPFFNLSTDASVDGRQFALAYFNELQLVPGFEVVPVGVVERTIQTHQIQLDNPEQARKLAQILGVDAVVLGAVTDFSPYYPPRCTMQVEWYTANPCFHPIPAGYGLPWGTPDEEFIPAPLVFQAEMALAKAQLRTQTPPFTPPVYPVPPQPIVIPEQLPSDPNARPMPEGALMSGKTKSGMPQSRVKKASAIAPIDPASPIDTADAGPPENWPDARSFVPAPPCSHPPDCQTSIEPVLRHTKAYNGQDSEFTEALASYYFFQDDGRFGGWQSYLQRSDDFIRFCCHMHVFEMLSARGGAGETRVVWRWSHNR